MQRLFTKRMYGTRHSERLACRGLYRTDSLNVMLKRAIK